MPLISAEEFVPTRLFKNGHYNTLVSALFYRNPAITFERKRLITPDNDFLDIDFSKIGSNKAVVICHGLEGNSSSGYILHFTDYYNSIGWDVICPNYRGCSGEMNRSFRMYNSGTTDDLDFILKNTTDDYDIIVLIGFSLGGNLILKYLGEQEYEISENIKTGIAISAPIHLSNASKALLRKQNFLYQLRFINSLNKKVLTKSQQFPGKIDTSQLWKTWNVYQFDERFTAPIYGYNNAEDYYDQNSSINFIDNLERPAMLINAEDDPFLGELCYPIELANDIDNFYLSIPKYGGHVGFAKDFRDRNWLKSKTSNFISKVLSLS